MAAKVTLLHLSDLHFSKIDTKGHYWNSESRELLLPAHDRRGLIGGLIRDLRKEKIKPDIVIISGDLLDKANEYGAELAIEFINNLANSLKLDISKFVICPGNHDVIRRDPNNENNENTEKYKLYGRIWNSLFEKIRSRFEFNRAEYEHVQLFDYCDEFGIEIISFNTCEGIEPGVNEHGSIGIAQRDTVELLLYGRQQPWLRIGVMHHHLEASEAVTTNRKDYSEIQDAPLVRSWMVDNDFSLVFHGHQHVSWHTTTLIKDKYLSIIAGGSLGVGNYGRKDWQLPLTYQVLTVESNKIGYCQRREFDSARLEWTASRSAPLQKILFGPSEEISQAPPSKELTENPFNKRGTLSFDHPSYVVRQYENTLVQVLNQFGNDKIVIYGSYSVGKSSLMLKIQNTLSNSNNLICYIDFENIRTDDDKELHQGFFDLLNQSINSNAEPPITDWNSLGNKFKNYTGIRALFIDELGRILRSEIAHQFLSGLLRFASNYQVKIGVCLVEPIANFLRRTRLYHGRFREDWNEIFIANFTDSEMNKLFDLLPARSRSIVHKFTQTIIRNSDRNPKALQCLAFAIFEADRLASTDKMIIEIINDRNKYK